MHGCQKFFFIFIYAGGYAVLGTGVNMILHVSPSHPLQYAVNALFPLLIAGFFHPFWRTTEKD